MNEEIQQLILTHYRLDREIAEIALALQILKRSQNARTSK